MNSKERDASLERLIAQAMRDDARPAGPCLDADTIAAWTDGTLSGPARGAAETHAASCLRCQAVLAAMARSAAAESAVMDGALAEPSTLLRGIRWLVPLAGAALAAVLVLAIWPGREHEDRESKSSTTSGAPADTKSSVASPKDVAESAPGRNPSSDAPVALPDAAPVETVPLAAGSRLEQRQKVDEDRSGLQKKTESASRPAKERDAQAFRLGDKARDEANAKAAAAEPPGQLQRSRQAAQSAAGQNTARSAGQAQGYAAAPSAVQSQNQASQNQGQLSNQMQNQPQAQNQAQAPNQSQAQNRETAAPPRSAAPAPAAPSSRAAAASPRPEPLNEAVRVDSLAERTAPGLPVIVATPVSSVVWRILNQRDIQRSDDSGASWTTQTTVLDAKLTAGSCSSTDVCWMAGDAGVVLRTADGRTWQRVALGQPLDLAEIKAASDRSAVVTTRDGRTFVTSDGGKTWGVR